VVQATVDYIHTSERLTTTARESGGDRGVDPDRARPVRGVDVDELVSRATTDAAAPATAAGGMDAST
jgi:ribosomal protein L12E/L44/L45/RPP1/RPP2